ncbi:MAG: hypothetical protein MUP08_03000, partial [Desulfobulbaceae bacterium]|nr:hypothetical protein [Desulfobulbaceae bacterium]
KCQITVETVSVRVLSVEVSRLQGRGRLWDWFLDTKIFILLKKIVVDVENNNDIPQFPLMFPGEG